MWLLSFAIVLLLLGPECLVRCSNCTIVAKGNRKFPKDFSFGVATSAYQIEGAWNADGKGESIWDEFTHKYPDKIKDGSNGDKAAESYHKFDLDLKALKQLKVNHYRFSIAWTRIFPSGDVQSKNQKGIDYYNSVINKLLANGIEPMVTMYHWDLPVGIQKFGGFTNSLIIQQFRDYAEELFKLFGDRVKTWITFNEPHIMICKQGYGDGIKPPMVKAPGVGDYMCLTNLLKAHAVTYRLYRSIFFEKQRGKIGITLENVYLLSKSNNSADLSRGLQYLWTMLYPIYSDSGDFPPIVLKEIEASSQEEGRSRSRLPSLGEYWKKLIQGSADFLGINYYTSRYIKRNTSPTGENPSMDRDFDLDFTTDPSWPKAKSSWLYCIPQSLETLLKNIRDDFGNVEVKITENGWSDEGELEDNDRIRYLKSHIQAVLNAINDGCNVTSYSAWSLVDNFEWKRGYTEKFGLYSVNMTDPKRERTPKKSAFYYKKIIETRSIP